MTSCPVLRCLAPRLPVLSVGFGSVFCSMPLGRIAGPPVTPLSLTIPARKSATICFSAAFPASRRSVRASRSPRDSSERGIFSGTDMLGTNRVRYEQGQPRSSSYLPGFLPQVLNGQQAVTAISALWLRRSTAFRWLQQPIGRHLMIDVVEQVIERHQEVKNEGISERSYTPSSSNNYNIIMLSYVISELDQETLKALGKVVQVAMTSRVTVHLPTFAP